MPKPNQLNLNAPIGVKAFTDATTIEKWRTTASDVQAREQDDATITIYDVIGYDWWTGEGFTSKRLNAALRSIGDRAVTVNINSPGGDVFEGVAIFNELLMHPHKVTVNIVGMAASTASFIAMAGDEINMGKGSVMMIHEAMSGVAGTATVMHEVADYVGKVSDNIAALYAERSGQKLEDVKAAMAIGTMNLGTYYTAEEAIDIGLADGHYEGETVTATPKASNSLGHTKRDAEQTLTRAGMTRSQARNFLNKFDGKQDAASEPVKQDADGKLAAAAAQFKADLSAA